MTFYGTFPCVGAAFIFLCGLWGATTSKDLVHLVMCLGVLQSSTYVLLVAIGYRDGGVAPVFDAGRAASPAVDPVVQALTLTDIVVEATVVALLLAFAIKAHENGKTLDPDEIDVLRG